MRHCGILVCAVVGVALNIGAAIRVSNGEEESLYSGIVNRNAFGLQPPAMANAAGPSARVISRPKIKLAGITTILDKKVAFLMVSAANSSAPRECLLLSEGQQHEDIQVREISERYGIVKVINHGEEQVFGFDDITSPANGVDVRNK